MKDVRTITVLFPLLLGTGLVSAANMTDEKADTNEAPHFFLQEASKGVMG